MRTSRLIRLVSRGAVFAALGVASIGVASPVAAAEATADRAIVSPLSVEWTAFPSRDAVTNKTDDHDQVPMTGLEEQSIEWT